MTLVVAILSVGDKIDALIWSEGRSKRFDTSEIPLLTTKTVIVIHFSDGTFQLSPISRSLLFSRLIFQIFQRDKAKKSIFISRLIATVENYVQSASGLKVVNID